MTSAADDDNIKLLPEEWERLEVSFSWRGMQKTAAVDMVCHILPLRTSRALPVCRSADTVD